MSAAEFTAALPEPHTILGLKLLPLSLGRYRLLKRFDSPFVDDEDRKITTEEMIRELIFALIICGLPCAEFNELLLKDGIKKECERFGKIIRKVVRKTKHFNMLDCLGQFKEYLEAAQSIPWHPMKMDGLESESISHWSHNVEVVLRSRINWSQKEIEEAPMQKALCDFFKYLEGEGAVRLISHEDYAALCAMGEANANALEKMNEEIAALERN